MKYRYDIQKGVVKYKTKTKRYVAGILASMAMVGGMSVPAIAVVPGAAIKNQNANTNACWGMDRAYYASQKFFSENMDIKQSFPGDMGEQRAAWVATYCDSHGPTL